MWGSNLNLNMSYTQKVLCNLPNATSKLLKSTITAKAVTSILKQFQAYFVLG